MLKDKTQISEQLNEASRLLSKGRIDASINKLESILQHSELNPQLLNQLRVIKARHFHIEVEFRKGIISIEEAEVVNNKIIDALIASIDAIEDEVFTKRTTQSLTLASKEHGKIEIILNQDFDSFSEEDMKKVLDTVSKILAVNQKSIKVRDVKEGSTRITLEFENDDEPERLFLMIKRGELRDKKITDAKLRELIKIDNEQKNGVEQKQSNSSFFHSTKDLIKDGRIEKSLDQLDEFLKGRDPYFYNQIIVHKADLKLNQYNNNLGIDERKAIRLIRSQITFAVLSLIDELISKDEKTVNNV